MTIKNTKSKGFTISTNGTEVVLQEGKIDIFREKEDGTSKPYTVMQPGEYDVGHIGIQVNRIPNNNDNESLAFILFADEITVGYFPTPPEALSEKAIEKYDMIDVLLIPGNRSALIDKLAPGIVIPLSDNEVMAKSLGSELPEVKASLTLNSADQLPEELELINLG